MTVARRRFIAMLASLPSARVALAQPRGKPWRIGFLSARRRPESIDADYYGAFPRRLRELGYVEGRDLVIEWRFAEGDYARLAEMAAELVRVKSDVILALGPPGVAAAQKATTTTPIVIVVSGDPVAAGFVRSLAKPGGNITGLSNLADDLIVKHIELLRASVAGLERVAMLVNPGNALHGGMLKNARSAAQKARIVISPVEARTAREIEDAFAAIGRERADAVIVALDPLFIQQAPEIAARALRLRLPSIFAHSEAAQAGGLLSYGQNQQDIYVRAAGYVDRILKGAKPADMPIEQPTRLELVINGRTAKAIGVPIAPALRASADLILE